MLTLLALAAMARPTDGGQFSYDSTDVLAHWDEPSGLIRVHYSTSGTNQADLTDADDDGVPDYVAIVGLTAVEAWHLFADDLGVRSPLRETDLGSAIGGSEAFDVYLVDFGGNADGHFGVDRCSGGVCSGYLVIENDFQGYGYSSLQEAADVLTSHELFHGVQYAYTDSMPNWFAEGTAVWAEKRFDEASWDFMRFADAYLEDVGRSLDRPPTGPVPAFAYATCLYWDFLTIRLGNDAMADLMLALEGIPDDQVIDAIDVFLEDAGDPFDANWPVFASWNLATWPRNGLAPSYDYAADIGPIAEEAEGPSLDEDHRFYPLASSYFHLVHPGGPLWFGIEEGVPELVFAVQ